MLSSSASFSCRKFLASVRPVDESWFCRVGDDDAPDAWRDCSRLSTGLGVVAPTLDDTESDAEMSGESPCTVVVTSSASQTPSTDCSDVPRAWCALILSRCCVRSIDLSYLL